MDEAPSFDEDTEAGDEDEDIEAYEEDEDIEAGDPLDEPDPELEALLQRRREARWLDDWAGWRGGWNYFHHVWMFVDRYNRPLYRLSLAAKGKEREKLDYFVAGVVEFNPQKEAVLSHKGLVEAYQRMVNSIPVKIIFIPLGARIEPGDIDRVLAADALFFPDLLLGLELPRAGEGLSMERRDSPEAGPESDVAEPRTAPVVEPASASEPLGLREQAEGGREISSTKPVEGPPGVQRYDSVEGLLFASWQARYERERLRRRQPPKPPPTSEPPEDDWDEDEELNRRSSGRKIAEAQARKVWVSSRGLSREISKLGDQIDGWVPEPDPGFRALVERYGSGKGSSLDRKRFFCFLEALTLRNPEGAEILAHPRIGDVYRLASPRIDDLIDMKHLGTGLRVGDIEYPDSDSMMADLEPLLARLHGRIRQYTVLGGIRGMGGKEGR